MTNYKAIIQINVTCQLQRMTEGHVKVVDVELLVAVFR